MLFAKLRTRRTHAAELQREFRTVDQVSGGVAAETGVLRREIFLTTTTRRHDEFNAEVAEIFKFFTAKNTKNFINHGLLTISRRIV